MSFVLVSPSTLSWSHVRAVAGRSSPWSAAGSIVASVRTIASIVAILGWIIPTPLAMPVTRTRRTARPSGSGRAIVTVAAFVLRVGRSEGLRGRGERVVGRREARRERVDAGGDLVERQPRADDAGREEERPLRGDPQRAGEEPRDLGLVGVAGGTGRGVGGAARRHDRLGQPERAAPPGGRLLEVLAREPDRSGREGVRGEDRRRARRRRAGQRGDDREVRPARRLDPGDARHRPGSPAGSLPDARLREARSGAADRPSGRSVVAAGSDCPCPRVAIVVTAPAGAARDRRSRGGRGRG